MQAVFPARPESPEHSHVRKDKSKPGAALDTPCQASSGRCHGVAGRKRPGLRAAAPTRAGLHSEGSERGSTSAGQRAPLGVRDRSARFRRRLAHPGGDRDDDTGLRAHSLPEGVSGRRNVPEECQRRGRQGL